jgi:uncharacterized protein Smg (DUF494 family)
MTTVMSRHEDLHNALVELLTKLGAAPDIPINILTIGPTLVDLGFSQDEIVNSLFYLESHRNLKLIPGNRLQVLSPPSSWRPPCD